MMTENALMHYGVKGMRWGVRKDRESGSQTRNSLSPETKKKIAITGTVAVGALAAAFVINQHSKQSAALIQQNALFKRMESDVRDSVFRVMNSSDAYNKVEAEMADYAVRDAFRRMKPGDLKDPQFANKVESSVRDSVFRAMNSSDAYDKVEAGMADYAVRDTFKRAR